jgi:hypothetical protein
MRDDAISQLLAVHYRQLASEAALQAELLLPSKWREAYEKIAAHWTELANEIDDHCREQHDTRAFGGD